MQTKHIKLKKFTTIAEKLIRVKGKQIQQKQFLSFHNGLSVLQSLMGNRVHITLCNIFSLS